MQAIEELELTHVPYRPWCKRCVRGAAREDSHQATVTKRDSEARRVEVDRFVLGENTQRTSIVWVVNGSGDGDGRNRDEGQVESAGMLRIRYERSKESGSLITSASSIDLRTLIRRAVPVFLIA